MTGKRKRYSADFKAKVALALNVAPAELLRSPGADDGDQQSISD